MAAHKPVGSIMRSPENQKSGMKMTASTLPGQINRRLCMWRMLRLFHLSSTAPFCPSSLRTEVHLCLRAQNLQCCSRRFSRCCRRLGLLPEAKAPWIHLSLASVQNSDDMLDGVAPNTVLADRYRTQACPEWGHGTPARGPSELKKINE